MDYKSFLDMYSNMHGSDFSARSLRLSVLRKVLDGTLYDILQYPFVVVSQKTNDGGGGSPYSYTRLPMSARRPSVISTLCATVVDDSVSFLFGEGRFPRIAFGDEATQKTMERVIEECALDAVMTDVATDGSVGSGCVLIKIINSKFYFESLKTEYLTPVFCASDPSCLEKLTQKYKVLGGDLQAMGYANIKFPNAEYWYMREWTMTDELCYLPWRKEDENAKEGKFTPKVDASRSVRHGLGFVPAVWIKNLSGGDMVDGRCTFQKGITTNINLDYQMSQCGRGLTYSSEPILFWKNPGVLADGKIQVGDGAVLVGGEDSDAKMIEINGEACMASLAYEKALREIVLENIHGNRSDPDRSGHDQSGTALKMLHHPLILLASKLRHTYGKIGLPAVIKMMMAMMSKCAVKVNGKTVTAAEIKADSPITLIWPAWFDSDPEDDFREAQTLGELTNGLILSKQTAVKSIAEKYGIQDTQKELGTIAEEQAAFNAAQPSPPAVKEMFKS